MAETMLRFVDIDRQMPEKADPQARRDNWHEIYQKIAADKASEQASRCSQCGVPFCQVHCPLHNNIPDWLMLAAQGRLEEAYEISSATNNFPEICGRICPQDRLCEGSCVIEQSDHGTVTIGAIETYITDTAFENGWVKPVTPLVERGETIAVIGAGPGGLAAAEMLRRLGYGVDVYDRHDRVGGLLMYGIPSFKLEKEIVFRRAKLLEDGGVRFHLNTDIGTDITFAELRDRHDAVLIATGVYAPRDVTDLVAECSGTVQALDYLIASNRSGLGDTVPGIEDGTLDARNKRVVVVGGGDTAMDCVRTAVRQGAKSVACLYRRNRENMPGSTREVVNAEEEGVEFIWLASPEAFLGEERLRGVRVQKMRLGLPDKTGRQWPEPVKGSSQDVEADLVIKALGFDPEDLPVLFDEPDLAVTKWGTVKPDKGTSATSLNGVFAAGDIVRGASLVVWAIHDGRAAAGAIHKYIQRELLGERPGKRDEAGDQI